MPAQAMAGKFKVEIDGTELPAPVDNLLTHAIVDCNANQPDLFVLTFRDPDRAVLATTGARIGSKVKIFSFSNDASGGDKLLSGDVTALEAQQDGTGTFTVVRGYDESHLLFRGRSTHTYQNMTYSDIATKVAQRAGLTAGQIDSTSPVQDYVAQSNQNDWMFLRRMAVDVGFEVLVEDGKLHFRQPASSSAAPGSGDLTHTNDPLQLTSGAHILRLRSVVTSAEQVNQIEVRGWDTTQKKALVGAASAGTESATIGIDVNTLANTFGNGTFSGVNVPYGKQAEVDAAAKAVADHIGGGFAEVEALVRGNSKLKPGVAVSLSLVGQPFDGKYTLTSVRHRYDADDGYTTAFTVSGRNQRSLLGLSTGGPGGGGPAAGPPAVPGVVPALVTDVGDPDNLGRVKVSFPWMSADAQSDWARMVFVGAGANRGSVYIPEVNDEVLVAFEHGDWRRPYVLGGLYNSLDTPPLGNNLIDSSSGAVKRRGVISKDSHALIFFDDPGNDGVALMTGDKGLKLSLNKSNTIIKITSSGKVEITGTGDITIKSSADVDIEAQSTLTLKGQSVSISGSTVSVSGNGAVSVSGQPIKLN